MNRVGARRYSDRFLNALMDSHAINSRAELYYNNALVGDLPLVSGTVSGDRSGSVRRTANIVVDPNVARDKVMGPLIHPYGSRVKCYRGLYYPDGSPEEVQVFYGRIDSVSTSLGGVTLQCSDLAADIVDARFSKTTKPSDLVPAPASSKVVDVAKAVILDASPSATVSIDLPAADPMYPILVGPTTSWTSERSDAMDSLCTQVGCEWFADMFGTFHIKALPAAIPTDVTPEWIVDTGDNGVLVDRVRNIDRSGVFNQVFVEGTPVNGTLPARGEAHDTNSSSPTYFGGPFGKVPTFYSGQAVRTNPEANALAAKLLATAVSSVRAVQVTCVANPKIQLAEVVKVFTRNANVDGLYYVQSFQLPLDPETPMTMTLYATAVTPGTLGFIPGERGLVGENRWVRAR